MRHDSTEKHCYACGQTLLLSEYSRNRSKPDGLADECKKCSAKRLLRWKRIEEGKGDFCQCGCGQRVRMIRGQSLKFIRGHIGKTLISYRTQWGTAENNPNWKGDDALPESGRVRAERRFKLGPCKICGGKAENRHHRDRNPLNNLPSNILILCDKCHCEIHLKEQGQYGFIKRRREEEPRCAISELK